MRTTGVALSIEVIGGGEDGMVREFTKFPITIGRHFDDELQISSDSFLSRHHARIFYEGGNFYLEDVGKEGQGSANGTFLNGVRINRKSTLSTGDVIVAGNTRFKLLIRS